MELAVPSVAGSLVEVSGPGIGLVEVAGEVDDGNAELLHRRRSRHQHAAATITDNPEAGPVSGHLAETKSRVSDPDGVRRTLREGGAVPSGVLRQRDTYFRTRRGWLKLRQEQLGDGPATADLIAYERAAGDGHVLCTYSLTGVSDPDACRHGLAAVLGVLVVVDKRREVWRLGPTVVHVDEVAELGWYVELETETVGSDLEPEQAHHRLAALLGLPASGPPVSYADLLIGDRGGVAAPNAAKER